MGRQPRVVDADNDDSAARTVRKARRLGGELLGDGFVAGLARQDEPSLPPPRFLLEVDDLRFEGVWICVPRGQRAQDTFDLSVV